MQYPVKRISEESIGGGGFSLNSRLDTIVEMSKILESGEYEEVSSDAISGSYTFDFEIYDEFVVFISHCDDRAQYQEPDILIVTEDYLNRIFNALEVVKTYGITQHDTISFGETIQYIGCVWIRKNNSSFNIGITSRKRIIVYGKPKVS